MKRNLDDEVSVQWGFKIPLRDAVALSATLYRPASRSSAAAARGPQTPVIVTLTPYTADTYHERGMKFARAGFVFLIVDVRGRGNSGGTFNPLRQESHDGHDVIEWVAEQSFCDGQVAMWGGSYAGHAQWATAKERPAHLKTIAPVASPFAGVDFPMRRNVFYPYLVQWLAYTSGRTLQRELFADQGYWSSAFLKWHESGRSFDQLDTSVGFPSERFQEWISHREPDEYWDAYNPNAEQYEAIDLPVLTITGAYDDNQPGALEHYKRHIQVGARQHYLVIGPWDHAGTRTPKASVGGVSFGPESLSDLQQLHEAWYRWVLLDGPRPTFLTHPIRYYQAGTEEWRGAEDLDSISRESRLLFLESAGGADSVSHAGYLQPTPGAAPPDCYRFDPRHTGRELFYEATVAPGDLTDSCVLHALSGRLLVYQSAPLEAALEISGFFSLQAWISIDCPDTDLYVSVHEIAADGASRLLSTDAVRARYREGLRKPRLIQTREPQSYEFNGFTFIARTLPAGHCLRLVVAPVGRLVEGAFWQRNCNAGGCVSSETVAEARPVTVTLFHDVSHPSVLRVPVGRSNGAGELSVEEH